MSRQILLTVLAAMLAAPPLAASAERGSISRVDVGFSGRYKAGLWTPVRVHFGSPQGLEGAVLSVIVPDSDGVPSRVSAPLPSPAPPSLLVYARFGRVRADMTVRLERADEVLAERKFAASETVREDTFPPALLSEERLVIAVGRASLGIEDAVARMREPDGRRTTVARLEEAGKLPDRWYGYEGAAVVVLSGAGLEAYAGLDAGDGRIEELAKWVRRGGRLVVAVGEHGDALLAEGKPLAALLPGRFVKTVPLSQARSLEVFADSTVAMPMRAGGPPLRAAQLADVEGLVLAGEGNVPLVVRRAWQFGQATFVASDLDRGPVGEWAAREQFVARLLDWPVKPAETVDEDKAILHFGYTDLAGQLRSALDQFEGVRQIPFAVVIGVIAVYLLLIGPGDYFFLRKLARRMELTWVTFPATVVLFCAGACYLAVAAKGNATLVNQASVIDVDTLSGNLRGATWANVFSPRMQRCDVGFAPRGLPASATLDGELVAGWLGMPGRALGGMNPATPPLPVWPEPYDLQPAAGISQLPIQTWSSKSLTARWFGRAGATLEGKLEEQGPIPAGSVTNRLDFTLEDCLLAYGNWVYELGDLEPGRSIRIGPTLPRRELTSFLTGRKLIFDEKDQDRHRATPYDRESVDVSYILRAMMFFNAAGGRTYTRLDHCYQGFADLSDLLQPDRAVLVARPAAADAQTVCAGAAEVRITAGGAPLAHRVKHTTVYRFVLPVLPESSR